MGVGVPEVLNHKSNKPGEQAERQESIAGRKYKLAIIAPTSFFYQAPIFRELAAHPRIDLTVYFCSDEASRGTDVRKKFNSDRPWGDEGKTLQGYQYKFVRNYSPYPSYLRWPFGLMNFGLFNEIRKERPEAVVIMSWVNTTDLITISACSIFRLPLFFMTDANIQADSQNQKWISWIKELFLGKIVFRLAAGFLYTGTANKLLYQRYWVPEEKLVPFAYSWESKDFLKVASELKSQRIKIRTELGIPEGSQVILFCGRLSKEKAPLHLLLAFERVKSPQKSLIFVGDGALSESLKQYVAERDMNSVHFFGFQDRSEVVKFYAIADVLVIPSLHEATSAVLTEAMCFGLPVIASDQVGFGMDFIEHGSNGFIFPVADTEKLAGYITQIMETSAEAKAEMALQSREVVEKWSQLDLTASLLKRLDAIYSRRA